MRLITITDIRRRIRGLREQETTLSNAIFIESANTLSQSGRSNDIKRLIESMTTSSAIIPFRTYIKLYDALVEKGNVSEIKKMGTFIAEETMPKVRDANQTLQLIHRRLGRTKSKVNNTSYIHKAQDALQNSLAKAAADSAPRGELFSTPGTTVHVSTQETPEEAANECYRMMYENLEIYSHCDRVLENYDRVSKRFNLEILFNENTRRNGIYDTVVELCTRIDTYSMPTAVKFNTVIETALYGLEINNIEYTRNEILEAAIEYFLFKEDGLSSCKSIIDTTLFFDKNEDTKGIDVLMEDEPEDNTKPSISESVMSFCVPINEDMKTTDDGEADFEEIFNDFKKKELDKDPTKDNKLKNLITKLYSKNVKDVVDGTPKLFRWVRSFFILGSAAVPVIGPVLAAVSYIADRFITIDAERKEVEQMVICFNRELEAANNKLASTSDEQTRERLEKYIKSLSDGVYTIRNYYDKLFDDNENHPDSYTLGVEDKYGDDDFFMNEALLNHIYNMLEKESEFIDINQPSVLTEDTVYRLVRFGKLGNEDIINIATAAAKFPDCFYKDSVIKAIKDSMQDITNGNRDFDTMIDKYIAADSLSNALTVIKSTEPEQPTENLNEALFNAEFILEVNAAICTLIRNMNDDRNSTIFEASFTNTIRMASMKLKNAMTKASDKEKSMSRNLDAALNNFTKSIETSLTNDNREAVIKGSILPSASKVIKIALSLAAMGGAVGAIAGASVGIATAVIGLIGYLACSAKFKAKERQMVIDEIEIELKICQKYIDIAEQKNDMKALRELLSIQRNLERQHQRIKYKMKVDFGQKYYDAKAD